MPILYKEMSALYNALQVWPFYESKLIYDTSRVFAKIILIAFFHAWVVWYLGPAASSCSQSRNQNSGYRMMGVLNKADKWLRGFICYSFRGMAWYISLFLFLCSFDVAQDQAFGQAQETIVQSISIKGNKRIEDATILAKVKLKVGDHINTQVIREQIQQIYDMGFFADVHVQTKYFDKGVNVVFVVKEKPFTVQVVFDGNQEISDDKLQETITLRNQVFLDQREIKNSAEKIREQYQKSGYHNAKVIPIIQALDEARNRITFFIQEGERAKIRTIYFEGTTVVKGSDLLKIMANREWGFLSFATDAGILQREELSNDVERIKEFYSNRGYIDVQVLEPVIELSDDKESFILTFQILEGHPYTIGTVKFDGNQVFSDEELVLESLVKANDVFQRSTLRKEVTRITDKYGERGYSFTEVTPSLLPNTKTLTANVTYTINEGKLIRVREIHISGNDKTRDNVIRREMRVEEQEAINSVAIKRSFQRLNNLQFFQTVEILPKRVEEDKVDLEVKVKEKATGTFSIGGGFSTLDQLNAIINVSEGNLFGMGYMGRIRGQVGVRRTLGIATFRNPRVFDGPTLFQVDAFSTQTNFLTYWEERAGGTLKVGRAFSEYMRGGITLIGEAIRIKDASSDAPTFITDQVGRQSTTGFRASFFRDTRDNFQNPTMGSRAGLRLGFGTELFGGSNNFYRLALDGLKYVPLKIKGLRMSFRGRFGLSEGYGGDSVPLTELFFVGGINTVRGFRYGRAGPVTSGGTTAGGNKHIIFNTDFIFPIIPDANLNGVLFFDYGKGFAVSEGFDLDLRPTTGFEGRWVSPFGPLRAAWGINLDRRSNEQASVFEFSVGNIF